MCDFKDVFETIQEFHENFSSIETSSEDAALQKAITAIANKSISQDTDEGVIEFRKHLLQVHNYSDDSVSLSDISVAIECTAQTISRGQKLKRDIKWQTKSGTKREK